VTHRGALLASFALTIAVALVIGSQWNLIASRSAPADSAPAATSPAEQLVDPGMVSTEADGSGMAAQTGLSIDAIQTTSDPVPTNAASEQSQGSWTGDDDHEDHNNDHESDGEHDD
jgi:cell division septation protein DedD